MDSKFNWSIRVSRIYFQAIHLDIFENSTQFSLGFLVNLLITIIMFGGCCYTIWSYDTQIAFNAAVTLFGLTQVCSVYTIEIEMKLFIIKFKYS